MKTYTKPKADVYVFDAGDIVTGPSQEHDNTEVED